MLLNMYLQKPYYIGFIYIYAFVHALAKTLLHRRYIYLIYVHYIL